jgi:hypothetical protein
MLRRFRGRISFFVPVNSLIFTTSSILRFISMVQIDDKLISLDLFEQKFICDLPKCLGACCVEGESGAPLEEEEAAIIERIYPILEPFLSTAAKNEIARVGKSVVDDDDDLVTPIINGRECVYALFEKNGMCHCCIEKAYNDGLIDFRKPISCHLYPIRTSNYPNYEALNYHHWPICQPARELGRKEGVPVYRFLKDPIIRKYGEAFYEQMEEIEQELKASGYLKG